MHTAAALCEIEIFMNSFQGHFVVLPTGGA